MSLSMQSDSAVVSITRRPRSIASRCVSAGRNVASGSVLRVAVVDALDAVLAHQDRLRPDLERAQRGGGVGREERVAGAGGEDHDAALLEVADRAAADVRLRDLARPRSRTARASRRRHARARPGARARSAASRACRRSRRSRGPCPRRRRPCRGRCSRRRRRSRPRRRSRGRRRSRARSRRPSRRSMPYSRSPISASPESLSRTRRKARRADRRSPRGSVFGSASSGEREALELEHLGAFVGERLRRPSSCRRGSTAARCSTCAAKKCLFSMPSTIFSRACSGFDWHLVRVRVDLALGRRRRPREPPRARSTAAATRRCASRASARAPASPPRT